jgi:RHS repeat-associated protein
MENHLYDGDGNRVKGTVATGTTYYVGNYFEWTGSTGTMKKYYYAGGERVAMRTGSSTVNYLLSDHLGSTSVVADVSGVRTSEVRYKAWGEDRYSYGTSPTSYRYTGQRQEASIGLYFYGARWYDAALGRFTSPDSVIPAQQGVTGNDRYAYTNNNPLRFTDPSGHSVDCALGEQGCEAGYEQDETEQPQQPNPTTTAIPTDYHVTATSTSAPSGTPMPTSTYTPSPTYTASPTLPTATITPVATLPSWSTSTPDNSPTLNDVAKEAVKDVIDEFDITSPPSLHPYDILSPVEEIPAFKPYVPYVRLALQTVVTVIRHILPFLRDPIYPLEYPVPTP